jgi:hypothetical protein
MEPFNSSDCEFEGPPTPKWPDAGQRSIIALAANVSRLH